METNPACVMVYLRGRELDNIKLKTNCSFSIRELLMYYKRYREMVVGMEKS